MEKKITLVLTESELEIIQDAMSIAATQLYHQELGKTMGIDTRILSEKIYAQSQLQINESI